MRVMDNTKLGMYFLTYVNHCPLDHQGRILLVALMFSTRLLDIPDTFSIGNSRVFVFNFSKDTNMELDPNATSQMYKTS